MKEFKDNRFEIMMGLIKIKVTEDEEKEETMMKEEKEKEEKEDKENN